MKLRNRIDKLRTASKNAHCNPDYFPHISRTVEGATRLKLEFKAQAAIGRERVSEVTAMSDFELLPLLGLSGDDEGMALFTWREQNWIALLCDNLRVMDANRGEYGGPPLDKLFVEGPPIYFPLYVMYYDELFRGDPERASVCNYDLSKSASALVREWWESDYAARFVSIKELWLSENADWLNVHRVDYDPGQELATLLGIEVTQLPQTLSSAELEMILNGKLVEQVDEKLSPEAISADIMKHQAEPTEEGGDRNRTDE